MLSKKEFLKKVSNLPKKIPSKTRKVSYSGFVISNSDLSFYRVVPKTNWSLNLDQLYEIYSEHTFINTPVIKKATGGRVNSPSVAILLAIDCIDINGNRK